MNAPITNAPNRPAPETELDADESTTLHLSLGSDEATRARLEYYVDP